MTDFNFSKNNFSEKPIDVRESAPGEHPSTSTDTAEKNSLLKAPLRTSSAFWEMIRFAILALIIVVPVRAYVASPFVVSGSSMSPNFETRHYLIIDKVSYRLHKPERGDIIVFKYPYDTSRFFIKRIVGLPGENIEFHDGHIRIKSELVPTGFEIAEPYVEFTKSDTMSMHLKDGQYFVAGDNRSGSSDSRVWGALDESFIKGKVILRLFPLTKIDLWPEEYDF